MQRIVQVARSRPGALVSLPRTKQCRRILNALRQIVQSDSIVVKRLQCFQVLDHGAFLDLRPSNRQMIVGRPDFIPGSRPGIWDGFEVVQDLVRFQRSPSEQEETLSAKWYWPFLRFLVLLGISTRSRQRSMASFSQNQPLARH